MWNGKPNRLIASSLLLLSLLLAAGCESLSAVLAAERDNSQERLHERIVEALAHREDAIELDYFGKEASMKKDIQNILDNAIRSDDYLHYTVKTYGYKAKIKGNTASIAFDFTYWETLSQTNEVKRQVAQTIKRILTPEMNDHRKVKTIHDWIVANLAYDTALVSHSAYDGLVDGRTVCQGYALLTYEMMRQAGIPVRIVEGTSRDSAHTWNLVQIDGRWYHLDTTWNDPVPDTAGKVYYHYYNLTDEQIRADHQWDASAYPAAVSDYGSTLKKLADADAAWADELYRELEFVYMEDEHTATDVLGLTDKIRDAVELRRDEIILRYTNGSAVETDMKKAFDAQRGVSRYTYSYEDYTRTKAGDKLLRIRIEYA
ncbi:transglutaminase domain-containing protein [Paenibacillaceae bacterium WGS1546]|uniref:transglutaminase domain-containing protein n=1 Tax=Cohnella sp. WGS1546 TaxID=3366810 RepID=UPI00372D657E